METKIIQNKIRQGLTTKVQTQARSRQHAKSEVKLLKDRHSHVHFDLGEANPKEQPMLLSPRGTLQNFAIGPLR